jgi:hypothetical protein
MTQEDTSAAYLDLYEDDWRLRVRKAFGRGLYPTGWGDGTPGRSLNSWLDIAMKNVRNVLRY